MKTRILLAMMALTASLTANAQPRQLVQEEADSTIDAIAYFCKNDTMKYEYKTADYKIVGSDTTRTAYTREEFMLVVRDSTSKGYRIEYIPQGMPVVEGGIKDAPTASSLTEGFVSKELWKVMGNLRVVFTTDEYGELQHIENWRDIKKSVNEGIKLLCDKMYTENDSLESVIPRKRFEGILNLSVSTEEGVKRCYDELALLFGMHGKSFTIGEVEIEDSTSYPSRTRVVTTYAKYDDQSFEDDYNIQGATVTTIPLGDVATLGEGVFGMMASDEAISKMGKDMKKVLDNTEGDMKISNLEDYYLFYNGWPCYMSQQMILEWGGQQTVKTKTLEWTFRHWNEAEEEEEEEQNI